VKVAILGGTGAMGRGLAKHLSRKNEVVIGSRDPRRAQETARGIDGATGSDYISASKAAEVAVFVIPYSAIEEAGALSGALAGKTVVSVINPLKMEGGLLKFALKEGSAAEVLASLLPKSHVATAFNHVSSLFFESEEMVPMDILVAADTRGTFDEVAALVKGVPNLRPLYAGPLTEAGVIERITPLLLNLAKLNRTGSLTTRFASKKDAMG
jgi:8-hydroxy-5-deazaflavin:NADPH oxidoreductase